MEQENEEPKRKGGRPKGGTNIMTREIKDAIFNTFDVLGREEYLAEVAVEQPAIFCGLLAKLLPSKVQSEVGRAGDFDNLTEAELEAAIRERLERVGFYDGRVGDQEIIEITDTVHTDDTPQLPASTPPPTDSGSTGEG